MDKAMQRLWFSGVVLLGSGAGCGAAVNAVDERETDFTAREARVTEDDDPCTEEVSEVRPLPDAQPGFHDSPRAVAAAASGVWESSEGELFELSASDSALFVDRSEVDAAPAASTAKRCGDVFEIPSELSISTEEMEMKHSVTLLLSEEGPPRIAEQLVEGARLTAVFTGSEWTVHLFLPSESDTSPGEQSAGAEATEEYTFTQKH